MVTNIFLWAVGYIITVFILIRETYDDQELSDKWLLIMLFSILLWPVFLAAQIADIFARIRNL